jgi:deazaflavin-dependent oxidoreductase (nitroreductase family)
MWTRIAKLFGALLLAVGVIGIVFVTGMRAKWPLVLNAVRRSGRATKRIVLKSSGTPGGIASIIRHVGRTTGRPYETPVQAVATDDGFVIALPYGPNTDWLKNVLASGSATIVHEGNTYRVDGRRSFQLPWRRRCSRPRTTGPIVCSASNSSSWSGRSSRTSRRPPRQIRPERRMHSAGPGSPRIALSGPRRQSARSVIAAGFRAAARAESSASAVTATAATTLAAATEAGAMTPGEVRSSDG